MDLQKLTLCRICLVEDEDVKMHNIINTSLQVIYETLTAMPFETKDSKPMQICYICFANLRNCYNLQVRCLESEKWLTQMLQNSEVKPATPLHDRLEMLQQPLQWSIIPVAVRDHEDYANVSENFTTELSKLAENVQVKQEDFEAVDSIEEYISTDDNEQITSLKTVDTYGPASTKSSVFMENIQADMKLIRNENTLKNVRRRFKSSMKNIVGVYSNDNDYKCDMCTRFFCRRGDLTRHIQRSHTGGKPLECSICKQQFRTKNLLVSHIRLHTGERPYKCDTCGKCFRIKSYLDRHINTHVGAKPFKCEICEVQFSRRSHVKQHMLIHKGEKKYKCKFCKKYFSHKGNLTSHIRTHTGEKPHNCDRCGKRFSRLTHLKRHLQIHTGEKQFKCDICGKCFNQKSKLCTHIRMHMKKPCR